MLEAENQQAIRVTTTMSATVTYNRTISWLVGALSPVNHKGLHQRWKQTSVYLLVIHWTNCKTFHVEMLNNSLKTLHTNITLPHFIVYKTHRSLARNQTIISGITFRKSEYKDLSSKYFFLTSNKSAHSIKICLTVITVLHATQTGASSFFKIKEYVNKSDQYVIYLKQCFLSLCYKKITLWKWYHFNTFTRFKTKRFISFSNQISPTFNSNHFRTTRNRVLLRFRKLQISPEKCSFGFKLSSKRVSKSLFLNSAGCSGQLIFYF